MSYSNGKKLISIDNKSQLWIGWVIMEILMISHICLPQPNKLGFQRETYQSKNSDSNSYVIDKENWNSSKSNFASIRKHKYYSINEQRVKWCVFILFTVVCIGNKILID